jgi:hypothetical protein
MKLGTHMPGGERRKPIEIEDRRTKVDLEKSVTHQMCKSRVANLWMDNVTLTFDPQPQYQ